MIDIVITWVDGNDPEWIKEYKKYNKNFDSDANHAARFRDWDTLRYVFRGIEKFMPWVNKIHLVTMNQKPAWLNINHPKVNLVSHEDIFKNKDHLPTFSANAIEMNFLGVKDLAEKFILFNDDMMVLDKVSEDDFFRNELPRDFSIQNVFKDVFTPLLFRSNIWVRNIANSMNVLNQGINKRKNTDKSKWINNIYGISGNINNMIAGVFSRYYLFDHYHHPQPYLKSIWEETIQKNKDIINSTSANKFRGSEDVTQYLFRAWQLASGQFVPKYNKNFKTIGVDSIRKAKQCKNAMKKYTFLCINDEPSLSDDDYKLARKIVIRGLNDVMPDKSSFEK